MNDHKWGSTPGQLSVRTRFVQHRIQKTRQDPGKILAGSSQEPGHILVFAGQDLARIWLRGTQVLRQQLLKRHYGTTAGIRLYPLHITPTLPTRFRRMLLSSTPMGVYLEPPPKIGPPALAEAAPGSSGSMRPGSRVDRGQCAGGNRARYCSRSHELKL
jgi:hypothetical protein